MTTTAEIHSRTSSRQSQMETSRSDTMSTDNFFIDSYRSQESANSCRSIDFTLSKTSYENSSNNFDFNSQENVVVSRRGSRTLQTDPIFIGRNELEQVHAPPANGYAYETHSLPRRTCIHHKPEEYHTHSLPRREHHHHYLHDHSDTPPSIPQHAVEPTPRRMSSYVLQESAQHHSQNQVRRSSQIIIPSDAYNLSHHSSFHQQVPPSISVPLTTTVMPLPADPDECSTCESETDSNAEDDDEEDQEDEEQEIFIDFKPRLSPIPSPNATKRRKKLVKTMSEGENLLEKKRKDQVNPPMSASEDDLRAQEDYAERMQLNFAQSPIRDEDCFKADSYLSVSPDSTSGGRYSRESFRKRSVSLDDTLSDQDANEPVKKDYKPAKSLPPSPLRDELSVNANSGFPSSDSLANDLTVRDHSDGIWNESQITVLPAPPR